MLYESKLFTVKKNLVEKNDDLGGKNGLIFVELTYLTKENSECKF
jgi:hypothetical protein